VIVGTRSAEHSLRSHVGIGSESHCLLGQLSKILEISDSEAGLIKSGEVRGCFQSRLHENRFIAIGCKYGIDLLTNSCAYAKEAVWRVFAETVTL